MSIVDDAIKAAGGAAELAKACALSRPAVLFWRRLKGIPARHVPAVERVTGIPREQLRPDLFERTPKEARP